MVDQINALTERLSPLTEKIISHPVYNVVASDYNLRLFMGEHVFAVWDFMCLLKELHRQIVSTSSPWFPPKDALSANLIGSILVEEEGDVAEDGSYASHFDIYLTAMSQIGADTSQIQALLAALAKGMNFHEALESITIRHGTRQFVLTTFSFFDQPLHQLAAAFVYGREGITAAMFKPLLKQLESKIEQGQSHYQTLVYYLKRHITLDDNEHFPKALQMLANLVGEDKQKLDEAEQAAIRALEARIAFLTDIENQLLGTSEENS